MEDNKDLNANENGETPEKTFTQSDVDKIVQERLKREREKFQSNSMDVELNLKSSQEKVTKLEDVLEKMINPQLEQIPEPFKELVNGLSMLEKVEWLTKNKESLVFEKNEIPSTPNPKGEKNSDFSPYTKGMLKL